MKRDLNPQAYSNFIQEFQVEFTEIYGDMYEYKFADLESGKVKKTKKRINELNSLLRTSIENAREVTTALSSNEENKFEYLAAIVNMELQCASRYGKIIENDWDKAIENLKNSLEAYKRARKFVEEYKAKKGLKSDKELEQSMQTQMNICDEMIDLVP